MNFALVDPLNVINRIQSDSYIDPTVNTKLGWRWLPIETSGDGPVDPETQVRDGPVYAVRPDKVTETFSIRAKTPTELAADKDAKANAIDGVILKVLFNHENRIRAIVGQPAVTAAQFKSAVAAFL
jgi:hypothetical protein